MKEKVNGRIIPVEKGKKLFSTDNWDSYEVCKNPMGIYEDNKDVIAETKIRYCINNDAKAFTVINELKEIRANILHGSNDEGYGTSFEVFAISVIHDVGYEETYKKYIVNGTEDGGIDAVYWNCDIKLVYQIKLNSSEFIDKERMRSNYLEFLRTGTISESNTRSLKDFLESHKSEIKDKNFDIKIVANSKKSNFSNLDIFNMYFRNSLLAHKNNIKLYIDYYDKKSEQSVTKIDNEIFAIFYSAKKLIEALKNADNANSIKLLDKYFVDNVRGELSSNKEMIKTIENDRKNFVKYNNGITITGEITHYENSKQFIIENPIISNGQQTVRTLINEKSIDDIYVLLILKNVNDDNTARNIARYTNTQTKIKIIDLLSLNKHIRQIQKEIYEKNNGFYLNIYSSGNKESIRIAKKIYSKTNIINLSDFLRLYYCIKDNEIGKWKNSISQKLESIKIDSFDIKESMKVCECIKNYNDYILSLKEAKIKNEYKLADVAIMYISLKYNKSIEDSIKVIDKINNDYKNNKIGKEYKNTKELYRNNNVLSIIEKYVKKSRR